MAFGDHPAVRIEDYREDGKYVLRAELPGMNPEKNTHISIQGNELSITAKQTVETRDMVHSEFLDRHVRTDGPPPGRRSPRRGDRDLRGRRDRGGRSGEAGGGQVPADRGEDRHVALRAG
jgi:hypothetical protein